MIKSSQELGLCQKLRDLPARCNYRYDSSATQRLQVALFQSLTSHNHGYLHALFHGKVPSEGEDWILRVAQGAIEGAEYTEAARGKACGHIFRSGEATYRCKTCTMDDTCVLCSRCFDASDHSGHMVNVSISPGNSGCCDCGDPEAWNIPVNCALHTATKSSDAEKERMSQSLPKDLLLSIKMTIGQAFDYLCDVMSCSPEQLRVNKTEDSIRLDERLSRLTSKWYEDDEFIEQDPEYALVLWNDEKHTIDDVANQVARACKAKLSFGRKKANETNDYGRSVVTYSRSLEDLLKIAKIIEDIKITVTIRSSRDTFREQMCGTIVEWLLDVSGCSVDSDHNILRQTVCEEMLRPWRKGSEATNAAVGKSGIDDHEFEDSANARDLSRFQFAPRVFTTQLLTAGDAEDDDSDENIDDHDDGDDEAESQTVYAENDDMDLDLDMANVDADGDMEMRTLGDLEDETEVSEATFAGYPPPPPPPPPPPRQSVRPILHGHAFSDSDSGEHPITSSIVSKTNIEIPKTPLHYAKKGHHRPPGYWLEQPTGCASKEPIALADDLRQRVRLDWMILFDLRLWKQARTDLRDLYISTVVSMPHFKRILGLRFAGLYTVLAQLYLIADREPDHSIIALSLQMLTTPSITEEVVERGNFLTNLMSILYTFLTTRQVGHPWDVAINATLAFDAGSVTNRRMYHFFMDLKYLFNSRHVQEKMRYEERYILQFLDLIRLPQGICPNIRAVGEHVEYETDAWIGASLLTREVNRLCRQFAESFRWRRGEDETCISRVIRIVAKAAIVNSIGAERKRFDQAEIKAETRFKTLGPFKMDLDEQGHGKKYHVVDFVVEKEPISFHHALHNTLSWVIDCGKSMPPNKMLELLWFTNKDLKEPPPYKTSIPDHDPESYLIALFDLPLRVCAWLAQMKAGMWVRNGLSLRHQMGTYRGVQQRDLAHHRDIFLLQTAIVTCDPSRILASMIDRFGMDDWMKGQYLIRPGYEDSQLLDVAEDFIHLLIILLSDRTTLHPLEDEPRPITLAIRRDVAHILCFKPLSFSDLANRVADKLQDHEDFQEILEDMTIYRPPEGLSDSGTFELKPKFLEEIDPYIAHYSKNQRDEAENAYRNFLSRKTGKPVSEIIFEPKFRQIQSGVFQHLSAFTRTPLFAQIIYYSLNYALEAYSYTPNIPKTRVEAFEQVVLHLVLAAVLEDAPSSSADNSFESETTPRETSFVINALCKESWGLSPSLPTILSLLQKISRMNEFKSCHLKIQLILERMHQKRPRTFERYGFWTGPMSRFGDSPSGHPAAEDLTLKKKRALDRQAKVMAHFQQQQKSFIDKQGDIDWGDSDQEPSSGPVDHYKGMWKYPTGNCILCQEETNDTRLFGTFALMMESNVLRQTDLSNYDFLGEVLSTPVSLDRSAEDIRPFGVARQNRGKIRKLASDGSEILTERQGLGKGFPADHFLRGPVSTGCGHVMHYNCFDLYCGATQRRQSHQIARNHPERIEHKEFVCPLCKALGNTFLPIIWRGKEEVYPGVLQVEIPFDEWLDSSIGLIVSRFDKQAATEEKKQALGRYYELFVSYSSKAVIPPLASKLPQLSQPSNASPTTPSVLSRTQMPGIFPSDDPFGWGSLTYPSHPPAADSNAISELVTIYTRIRDTMKVNGLPSRYSYDIKPSLPFKDLTNTDTLIKTLGFSISATEIAQRGIESEPGTTLLQKIPPLALTHLRILSETASSYISIGGVRNSGSNSSIAEFSEACSRQLTQLFTCHPQMAGKCDQETWESRMLPPAFSQDSFVFLTECSVCLVPALGIDIHHIVRLCYLMELSKVTFSLLHPSTTPVAMADKVSNVAPVKGKNEISGEGLHALDFFLRHIIRLVSPQGNATISLDKPTVRRHYMAIATYALPFLRKVTILMHVRFGIDFPNIGFADTHDSELNRLTKALRLPNLNEMFYSVGTGESIALQSIIGGWLRHWKWSCSKESLAPVALAGLRPLHPAIFELIGLPKHYDTLTDETMRRRCPTTGRELVDPALCLFCGEIFCSQATCCQKGKFGGCSQHLEKCGREIGLFINIRKCNVLYLHGRNGSWTHAPYLDKHGEADPGLRRSRQLFLNQKRYDALLRNVWLQHGIPTTISRKLEADINNGGWESL